MKRIQCFPPRDARMCSLIRLVQDMDRTRQYWLDQRDELNVVIGTRTVSRGRTMPVMKDGFHKARLEHMHARNEYRWAQRRLRKYLLDHPEVIRDPAPYPPCPSVEDRANRIAAFYRRTSGQPARQPPEAQRRRQPYAPPTDDPSGEVPGRVGFRLPRVRRVVGRGPGAVRSATRNDQAGHQTAASHPRSSQHAGR